MEAPPGCVDGVEPGRSDAGAGEQQPGADDPERGGPRGGQPDESDRPEREREAWAGRSENQAGAEAGEPGMVGALRAGMNTPGGWPAVQGRSPFFSVAKRFSPIPSTSRSCSSERKPPCAWR
jgi:hypothetical protein